MPSRISRPEGASCRPTARYSGNRECKEFADLDVAREHNDPVLDKVMVEESDFYIPGSFNTTILRDVGDWSVLPPKEK